MRDLSPLFFIGIVVLLLLMSLDLDAIRVAVQHGAQPQQPQAACQNAKPVPYPEP